MGWENRGTNIVNAGSDFLVGISRGLKGVGSRIKREKHRDFFNSFCAIIGSVVAQNGQVKPEEIAELKQFLLNNRDNNAIGCWDSEEIISEVKNYAIKVFMGDNDFVIRAIKIKFGSDYAKIAILGALSIAFADGECDVKEAGCIHGFANQLQINLDELGRELGIQMPQFKPSSTQQIVYTEPPLHPEQDIPQPIRTTSVQSTVSEESCPMCKGVNPSNCMFCKGTGKKRKL